MGDRLDRLRATGRRLARRVRPWANLPTLAGVLGMLVAAWQAAFGFCGPDSEWPAGVVTGLVSTADGYRVVLLDHADRVQVYDPEWRFVRGWNVDDFGVFSGPFADEDGVYTIDTTRGRRHYDIEGRLLATSPLPAGGRRDSAGDWVPGSPWYWFLVNPLACFGLVFLGMGLALLTDWIGGRAR